MKTVPCINYEQKYDFSLMETVKISKDVNGITRKREVPIFTAKYGVEGLFHVIDKFNKASTKLGFVVADL